MTAKQKNGLAAALFLIWGGVVFWQWEAREAPVHVPLTNVTGTVPAGPHQKARGTGLRVNIELLASAGEQRQAIFTAPRNIFAIPNENRGIPVESDVTTSVKPQPASVKTASQQLTEAQVAPYRYLGFLRMGDGARRDMALIGRDDEVMVLKVGDHVEDHLILKAITSESVTIRDTTTRIEQRVAITEDVPAEEKE